MAFPEGWGRICPITVEHAQVTGSPGEYQLLLTEANLPSEMLDSSAANRANADGGDIRFSSDADGYIQLAREICHFTQSSNAEDRQARIVVKLPSISSQSDTTIYVWYHNSASGEPDPSDPYGRESVWPSAFVGVWHLVSDVEDSTSRGHDLTNAGGVTITSGEYAEFTGSGNSYLYHADHADFDISPDLTCLAVASFDSPSGEERIIGKGAEGSWNKNIMFGAVSSKLQLNFYDGSYHPVNGSTNLSSGTTYGCGATRNNTTSKVFVGGSLDGSLSYTGGMPATTAPLGIGAEYHEAYAWYDPLKLDGKLRHVMLLNVCKSDDWVRTWTTNYGAPATFASAGSPYSPSGETTAIEDVSLDLAAYHQELQDLTASLRAHDGVEIEDLLTALAAAGLDIEDLAAALAAYYQDMEDLPAQLQTLGQGIEDFRAPLAAFVRTLHDGLQAALSALGQGVADLRLSPRAAGYDLPTLGLSLSATDGSVLLDLVLMLAATDGLVTDDFAVYLAAIREAPSYTAQIGQRVSSVVTEVT